MKIIKISSTKSAIPTVETIDCIESPISDEFIKANIGNSNGKSWIEVVYGQVEDMNQIVIVCDEHGRTKALKPSIYLGRDFIAGDAIICAHRYLEVSKGFRLEALTEIELQAMLKKLKVFITI